MNYTIIIFFIFLSTSSFMGCKNTYPERENNIPSVRRNNLYNQHSYNNNGFNRAGYHRNGTRYDNQGFDVNGYDDNDFHRSGYHKNGTRYDAQGYDINGYNNYGFNRVGYHRNGTRYDNLGFDVNGGFNNNGFLRSGYHRNGTRYDAQGYDINGYNNNGFNRARYHRNGTKYDYQGYDIDGYNHNGFDKKGKTIFGSYVKGIGIDPSTNQVIVVDINGNIRSEALRYSEYGYNQMGYTRPLNYAALDLPDLKENFDRDGYNSEGKNFLGISKTDFERKSYDAILDFSKVQSYPEDINQLVARFNNSCFQFTDMDEDQISTIDIDETKFIPNLEIGGYQIDYIQGVISKGNRAESPIGFFLKDRLLPFGHPNHNEEKYQEALNEIKNYLKKSIYFCEEFLFSDNNLNKGEDINFDLLTLNKYSRYIKDKALDINYKIRFDSLQQNKHLDYLRIIENALNKNSILNNAPYLDIEDERMMVNKNLALKRFFSMYRISIVEKEKSDLFLRIIADKIANLSDSEKSIIAGYLIQGGAHCADARRSAINAIFNLVAQNEKNELELARRSLLGIGLESSIKASMLELKSRLFDQFIRSSLLMRIRLNVPYIDVESSYSFLWNRYSDELGLSKVGNAFLIPSTLELNRLFERYNPNSENEIKVEEMLSQQAINEHPYLGRIFGSYLKELRKKYTVPGNLTNEMVYINLFPKKNIDDLDDKKNDIKEFVDIKHKIFGPLWHLKMTKIIDAGYGLAAPEHPIFKSLLVRLGIFNYGTMSSFYGINL